MATEIWTTDSGTEFEFKTDPVEEQVAKILASRLKTLGTVPENIYKPTECPRCFNTNIKTELYNGAYHCICKETRKKGCGYRWKEAVVKFKKKKGK